LLVVKGRIALDFVDAIDGDGLGEPVVEILAALDVPQLRVIAPRLDAQFGRRLDPDIDIFREPVDDLMALRQRGPASRSHSKD
jgi:hypothetical protein